MVNKMPKRLACALLVALLTALPLAGCAAGTNGKMPDLVGKYASGGESEPQNSPAENKTAEPKETAEPDEADAGDDAFESFTELAKKQNQPAELIDFLREEGKKLSAKQAHKASNELLKRVYAYFDSQLDQFNELQSTSEDLYDLGDVAYGYKNRVEQEPIDAAEAKYLNGLIDNGLAFYFEEGLILDVDAAGLLSLFDDSAQGEAIELMRIVRTEQEKPSMLEGMPQIGEKEIVTRCLRVHDYLEQYPDGPFTKDAQYYWLDYYRMIFTQYGTLFEYDTGKMVAENKPMLERFAAETKGTALEPLMREYMELLKKEGWKKTKAVDDFLLGLGFLPEELNIG